MKMVVGDFLKKATSAQRAFRDGIESLRARIAELQAERAKIEAMPPTEDIAHQRVDAWVEGMAVTARQVTPEPRRFVAGPTHYPKSGSRLIARRCCSPTWQPALA